MLLTRFVAERGRVLAAVVAVFVAGAAVFISHPVAAEPASDSALTTCDALHVFGFQGTGESADATAQNVDSGFLGTSVTGPLQRAVAGVGRTLVPYAASFGGKPGDRSTLPYAQSMLDGVGRGGSSMAEYARQCPDARFAIIGYSQGGQVAAQLAREIGAGNGPVPADRVAAVSLFSDPTRAEGSSTFPGSPTGDTPTPPPGVDTAALQDMPAAASTPSTGGGIAPNATAADGFGALSGRVASWCTPGDLACDTPPNSTLAHLVTNVAGQIHLDQQDPQQTLIDVAGAVGGMTVRTAAGVINDNLGFDGDRFTVDTTPQTVLGRLAENSDPTSGTAPADDEVVDAVIKAGVMGFQAGVAVARKVLTPATIGELATVGLANPPAALALLGSKVATASLELFPPATVSEAQRFLFHEITTDIEDNAGLVSLATDVRYWDAARLHGTYDQVPVTDTGATPARYTVDWLTRIAAAITDAATSGSPVPRTTTTSPSPTPPPSIASLSTAEPTETTTDEGTQQR